ncbi:MAG: hypothetical protein GY749_08235 [Desulfobacteraceae bacterium]|nr:hypothetical protein [Desulfobacteraceae bacterium]
MATVPNISEEHITPLAAELIEIIHLQQEEIQQLKDEIARLKGLKGKPVIKPSALEKPASEENENGKNSEPGKGRIHKYGDKDLPSKFRPADIRAERCTLHSHAEHGNEDNRDNEDIQ